MDLKIIVFIVFVSLNLGSTQALADFYPGTDLYLASCGRTAASPNLIHGNGGLDLGFDHDLAGSGIYLNGFLRGQGATVPGQLDDYDRGSQVFWGGGGGIGMRTGRWKLLLGGYQVTAHLENPKLAIGEQPDDPVDKRYFRVVKNHGAFTRLSYELMASRNFSLQLDGEVQLGKLSTAGRAAIPESAVTLGLSGHMGKFCGGKALVVGAVVAGVVGLAVLACQGHCSPGGFSGWHFPSGSSSHSRTTLKAGSSRS